LTLIGLLSSAFAASGIANTPPCGGDNAAAVQGALRLTGRALEGVTSNPDVGLPEPGDVDRWRTFVRRDVADALGNPGGTLASYRVTYTVVDRESGRYTITARPLQYGTNGACSFHTDETQVIRYTTGDRPATSNDRSVDAPWWNPFAH
jgi:hypothetical protein